MPVEKEAKFIESESDGAEESEEEDDGPKPEPINLNRILLDTAGAEIRPQIYNIRNPPEHSINATSNMLL